MFTNFSAITAEIIEVEHFKEILSYIDRETLVVLDIDDTLLIPVQMLGCDEWFMYKLRGHQSNGKSYMEALEKSLAEWEGIRHLTEMQIVESGTEGIIHTMQGRSFCVMALTTQGLALATRTTQQLKANQIDLTVTAPSNEDCYLKINRHGVLYQNGILFTSGMPKGESLFSLCEKIGYVPKKIVFINDKASHLADMESSAIQRRVNFIGLRYAFSDVHKAAFSPEIAEIQFTRSSFAHILSDDEARSILEQEYGVEKE